MTGWVRLWHDMPTDPKWRVIARKSGEPISAVIAVFNFMLVDASQNTAERGVMTSMDFEDIAAALDLDEESVAAIFAAMEGKVREGMRLTGWERRQPKREREDSNSTERSRKHRESKGKGKASRGASDDATPCNAMQRLDADADADSENTPQPPRGEPPFAERLVSLWNEQSGLKGAQQLVGARLTKLRTRRKQFSEEQMLQGVRNLGRSDWHTGKTSEGWKADIGWFLKNDENVTKALELESAPEKRKNDPHAHLAFCEKALARWREIGKRSEIEEWEQKVKDARAECGGGEVVDLVRGVGKRVNA